MLPRSWKCHMLLPNSLSTIMFLVPFALHTNSLTHREELLFLILVDEELVADQTMVVEAFKDHPSSSVSDLWTKWPLCC